MRQNFVLKKNEEKGKEIAGIIMALIGGFFTFGMTIIALSMGFPEMVMPYMIIGFVFIVIEWIIMFTTKKEYHGYFAMEGLTIECRIAKYSSFSGCEWDVRVNDVPLSLNGNKKQQYLDYTCTINGSHSMIVKVIGTRVRPLSPVITIDGIPVVENDLVYVDKINQILNI